MTMMQPSKLAHIDPIDTFLDLTCSKETGSKHCNKGDAFLLFAVLKGSYRKATGTPRVIIAFQA